MCSMESCENALTLEIVPRLQIRWFEIDYVNG
jgi:hypothetical protein